MANTRNYLESKTEWRPTMTVQITEEQFLAMQRLLPHGMKRLIFGSLIDTLLQLLQDPKTRPTILAMIINKTINLPQMLVSAQEEHLYGQIRTPQA